MVAFLTREKVTGEELALDIPKERKGLPTVQITSSSIDKTDRFLLGKEWRRTSFPPK